MHLKCTLYDYITHDTPNMGTKSVQNLLFNRGYNHGSVLIIAVRPNLSYPQLKANSLLFENLVKRPKSIQPMTELDFDWLL